MFGGLLLSEVHCQMCGSFFKKIDPFLGKFALQFQPQFLILKKQQPVMI